MQKTLDRFYKKIKEKKLPVNGIIILKNDTIISEAFYAPYKPTDLHRMYSVSKSLTMIGIGLLLTEKKLKLEDKIVDHFKYEDINPLISKMTIKDLLTMKTTFNDTTYKNYQGPMVESFFKTKPVKLSGQIFSYDTSGSYVLSVLIEKITGLKMLDYIKQFYNFSKESYMIQTKDGHSNGGSTWVSTIYDLKLLGDIIRHDGFGKINPDYMLEAKSLQSETRFESEGHDFTYGYGYQTWLNSKKGFTLYGMYGQLVYYDKVNDLTLITTANLSSINGGTQKLIDLYHDYIGDYADKLDTKVVYQHQGVLIEPLNQEETHFNETYLTKEGTKIILEIKGKIGYLKIDEKKIWFSLIDHIEKTLPNNHQTYLSFAKKEKDKLYITAYMNNEELGTLYMDVYYTQDKISIKSKAFSERLFNEYNFNIIGKRGEE